LFTGIITDVGELVGREDGRITIRTRYAAASIGHGASISCDGCCLSVTSVRPEGAGALFSVDVSPETLSRTTIGAWQPGRKVNLERPLKAGDELGGHIVAGHVDGVARVVSVEGAGDSRHLVLEAPARLAPFIAEKGAVALDGTSLTVNEVEGARFRVTLIPLTLTDTTWGGKKPGDEVNLEVDLFARYVARLMEFRS
jgi:riboflavin synthase